MKKLTLFAALLSLLVVMLPGTAAAGTFGTFEKSPPTTLYFVHGIIDLSSVGDDGQPVNVLLNDAECLAEGVRFGEIAGPFRLEVGDYKLTIVPTESGCNDVGAIARTAVSLVGDENVSIIAHLSAEKGEPVLTEFVNFGAASIDLVSEEKAAQPLLAVRNTSAVSPLDVVAAEPSKGLMYNFDRLYAGAEERQFVADGSWQLAFSRSFSSFSAFRFEAPITTLRTDLKLDTANFFYAVGSANNGTFRVIQQTMPLP